jgi:GAF domain-containing protein
MAISRREGSPKRCAIAWTFVIAGDTHGRMKSEMELLAAFEQLLIGRWITDLANTSAFIMSEVPRLNWAGFYLAEGPGLVLGPFQGKPACTEIPEGKGVCGTAALKRETVVVPNVHEFPGHIACDAASQSEIVIPIVIQGKLVAVLDVDSPELSRFGEAEKRFLERLVEVLVEKNSALNSANKR